MVFHRTGEFCARSKHVAARIVAAFKIKRRRDSQRCGERVAGAAAGEKTVGGVRLHRDDAVRGEALRTRVVMATGVPLRARVVMATGMLLTRVRLQRNR